MLWLLIYLVYAAPIPTDCNVQMYNYYQALGSALPMQTALTLTPGTFMSETYVDIDMNFQGAAKIYQASINASLTNQTWVVDTSLDIPWCTNQILLMCCDNVSVGMAKTSNCTSLVDFDLGGSANVAGRMFIYSNQSVSCQGRPVVRFYNVTLIAGFFDADYTYEVVGLRDHIQMNYLDARQSYRTSTCDFSDGDPLDIVTQNIFRCTAQRIGCQGTRTNGKPTLPVIPIPAYSCIGPIVPNGTDEVIWRVYSLQPPSGIDGTFGEAFTDTVGSAAYLNAFFIQFGQFKILVSGTRRQFKAGYHDLNHYMLLFYNNELVAYQPLYPHSPDPIISVIPCICGFSMDCINGQVDLSSVISAYMHLGNALPIADPGPNILVVINSSSFTLDATASYDPDNLPSVLTVYWKVYHTPYDPSPPPFTIPDPTAFINIINSSMLIEGTYLFILYASDGQDITFSLFNVTVVPSRVFAILGPPEIVTFTFYTGTDPGHNCLFDYPPSPYLILNGSLSYSTDPYALLNYSWIQTVGPPLLYKCDQFGFLPTRGFFNTDQAIANFVPWTIGTYWFELTVTDGHTSSTASIKIQVNPDFGQPPSTFTPIINFTDPPIRNLTQPTRPIIELPNLTFPPLGPTTGGPPPTPPNVTVPPIIPPYPSFGFSGFVAMLAVIGGMILLFFIFLAFFFLYNRHTRYRYLDGVPYA